MVPALKKTFVVVALLVGLMALTVSGARDCQGWVGSSFYDLAPLERELRGQDLTTYGAGNTYFYSVCGVVSTSLNCQTVDDMTPAVCQRDSVGQYLDCGSQRTARFEQLPGGGESDGFSLSFSGGRDGRESRIHFQCNPTVERGSFLFVEESPMLTYTLQYVSKYACPANLRPSPAPSVPETVTLCSCGPYTDCRNCVDYPLGQCMPVIPMCTGQDAGFVRVDRQSDSQFLIRAYMDATCSLPLAQAVTGCDQCNGRVLARCSSSRASLPWWGIALIVVCTLLCAMVLALGAAVAYLLHSRHRQSRAMHSYQPVEVSLQTQEAAPSANTAALVDFDAVKE